MCSTPFSGAPILNAAVHRMCAWHMPGRNFVLNRPPYDLVNVAVKLDIDSSFSRLIWQALEFMFLGRVPALAS